MQLRNMKTISLVLDPDEVFKDETSMRESYKEKLIVFEQIKEKTYLMTFPEYYNYEAVIANLRSEIIKVF